MATGGKKKENSVELSLPTFSDQIYGHRWPNVDSKNTRGGVGIKSFLFSVGDWEL